MPGRINNCETAHLCEPIGDAFRAELVTKKFSRTRFSASELTVKQLDPRVFNARKKLSVVK